MPEGSCATSPPSFPFAPPAYDFARSARHSSEILCGARGPRQLDEAAAAAADTHADAIGGIQGQSRRAPSAKAAPPIVYPQRPGAQDYEFYVKTGRCKFGVACHFNHPPGIHE